MNGIINEVGEQTLDAQRTTVDINVSGASNVKERLQLVPLQDNDLRTLTRSVGSVFSWIAHPYHLQRRLHHRLQITEILQTSFRSIPFPNISIRNLAFVSGVLDHEK